MRIQKNDLTIRNAEKSDCDQLAAWWNNGNVMAHAGFPLGLNITAEEMNKDGSCKMHFPSLVFYCFRVE